MSIPEELRYTDSHEWARKDGKFVLVGITDYAQGQLGDVVYVDLPQPGKKFKQHASFGTIEAVKAAADLYSPVSGEIVEANQKLSDQPDLINKEPYGAGWLVKLKIDDENEFNKLMDAAAYKQQVDKA